MCPINFLVLLSLLSANHLAEARHVRHHGDLRVIEEKSTCKPKVRVTNEGRILINGLCDPTEKAVVHRNIETWLRDHFKSNGKSARISILPNGRVRVATAGDHRLQQQIKDFLIASNFFLLHQDFRRPLTSDKITTTVTNDGRILIEPSGGPLYKVVKKQIESYLRESNIVENIPNILKILPDGRVFVQATMTSTERETADSLVKTWLLQFGHVFANYDPNNPPRVKNSYVPIAISDSGQICIKTMDLKLKEKVQDQIIDWIRASLPALQEANLTFGATGEPIVSVASQLDAVKNLLIANRSLFKKYDPNQPMLPQKRAEITVDVNGNIKIYAPESAQARIKEHISQLLSRILPTDNATLVFVEKGGVEVLESQILTEFVKQFFQANKEKIESYNLNKGFPEITTLVSASVTSDGKLLLNGPQVLIDKFLYDLRIFLHGLLPDVNLAVGRNPEGEVKVEGANEKKLQLLVREFNLNHRDFFNGYNMTQGFSKVSWSVSANLDNKGHLKIDGPEPLRYRVKQDLKTWLKLVFGPKFSFLESEDGNLALTEELEIFLQQNEEVLHNYDLVHGFKVLPNRSAADSLKELSPTNSTLQITVHPDYTLHFQGSEELVRNAKTELVEWLKLSLATLLDPKISFNVAENGRVLISDMDVDDDEVKLCLASLVEEFLWTNKAAVESYNILDGFPTTDWRLNVSITLENRILLEGPASVVKLVQLEFEEWLRSLFPELDPSVTFVIGINGTVEVVGTNDSYLVGRLKKLIHSTLTYYKYELNNFHIANGFPDKPSSTPLTVTSSGRVLFAGPFAGQIKLDLIKWIRLHLSELNKQIEIDFLDNGEINIVGTDNEAEKRELKDLIKSLLQDTHDVLNNLHIINGLPKNIGWHLTITISPNSEVKFEGSKNLIERVRQDLAKWLRTQLRITDLKVQINVPLEGVVTVTGTGDKQMESTLEHMIKDFLQNSKDKIERYDILTGFPDAEWSVEVTKEPNGTLKFVGPPALIVQAKQDLAEWIRFTLPVKDTRISIVISESGNIETNGTETGEEQMELKRMIQQFLDQNAAKLKDYDIVTGFPKVDANQIPKVNVNEEYLKFSIAIQPDGRFVIKGPPLVVAKVKHDLVTWLTKHHHGNVSYVILENGVVDVVGADSESIRHNIKQQIKNWFLYNKKAIQNYDVVKGFPELESKATIHVTPNGTVNFHGSPLLVAKIKQDLIEWLCSFLPKTRKKINLTLCETGEIDVNGDISLKTKNSLKHQIKDFLLTHKSTIENYDAEKGFPKRHKTKPTKTVTSVPQVTDNKQLSVTTNHGKVIFYGPIEQQEIAKREFLDWFLNSFSELPPGVSLKFDEDGGIIVRGTSDELLQGMLKTNIEELVVAHHGAIENYWRTRTLPPIVQKIPALTDEGEQQLAK